MIFKDYEEYLKEFLDSQQQFDAIIREKEKLFAKTQPNATRFDKEKVTGGVMENAFDTYLERKDETMIDYRISEAESLLRNRELLLSIKKDELYASHDILDKVYRMNRIEKIRPYRIARILNYSVSQIYRHLERIDSVLAKNAKKCEKNRGMVKP